MRSRLVMILAVVLAAVAVAGAVRQGRKLPHPIRRRRTPPWLPGGRLPGHFRARGATGLRRDRDFTQAAGGSRPARVLQRLGEPFDTTFAQTLREHGVIPFVQIDPTDASVAAIAEGTYDDYLRSYADSVRNYGHAVVIGFGHEMNASWYTWGYSHVPPSTFVAAWRHIVTVFRARAPRT